LSSSRQARLLGQAVQLVALAAPLDSDVNVAVAVRTSVLGPHDRPGKSVPSIRICTELVCLRQMHCLHSTECAHLPLGGRSPLPALLRLAAGQS
jgi:hypothetical protein